MFTETLCTIARIWEQPRCPSTNEWIKKWYLYTKEHYSAIKRSRFESVVMRWMNLEPVIQSEVRKRTTNIIYKYKFVESRKNGTGESFCRARIEMQTMDL